MSPHKSNGNVQSLEKHQVNVSREERHLKLNLKSMQNGSIEGGKFSVHSITNNEREDVMMMEPHQISFIDHYQNVSSKSNKKRNLTEHNTNVESLDDRPYNLALANLKANKAELLIKDKRLQAHQHLQTNDHYAHESIDHLNSQIQSEKAQALAKLHNLQPFPDNKSPFGQGSNNQNIFIRQSNQQLRPAGHQYGECFSAQPKLQLPNSNPSSIQNLQMNNSDLKPKVQQKSYCHAQQSSNVPDFQSIQQHNNSFNEMFAMAGQESHHKTEKKHSKSSMNESMFSQITNAQMMNNLTTQSAGPKVKRMESITKLQQHNNYTQDNQYQHFLSQTQAQV